jgi:hypothetical protein
MVHKGKEASVRRLSKTAFDGSVDQDRTPVGFRHFLGTPDPRQRFRAYGIDPLDAPEHLPKIRALMNRLSRRMDAPLRWPAHHDATVECW